MRRLATVFRRHEDRSPAPPVVPGSHDDRLRKIPKLQVDPDDEVQTREDKAREQAYRDADRQPPFFG